MRVLWVWFTAITSIFIITLGWYIGNDVIIAIASQACGGFTGQAFSLVTLLEYVAAWWGPILDLIVVFWAIINSQEIDPNSVLYR
jgi:hypothetical protein